MATLSDIHVLIAEVERLQSELATAKCTGASEELRRLADEWETRMGRQGTLKVLRRVAVNKLIVDPGVLLIGFRIVWRPFWIGLFLGRFGYSNKPIEK